MNVVVRIEHLPLPNCSMHNVSRDHRHSGITYLPRVADDGHLFQSLPHTALKSWRGFARTVCIPIIFYIHLDIPTLPTRVFKAEIDTPARQGGIGPHPTALLMLLFFAISCLDTQVVATNGVSQHPFHAWSTTINPKRCLIMIHLLHPRARLLVSPSSTR